MSIVAKYLSALLLVVFAVSANALVIHNPGHGFDGALPVQHAAWAGFLTKPANPGVPIQASFLLPRHHGGHSLVVLSPIHPHWQAVEEPKPPAAVWEPSAGTLMVLGFAMLMLVRWRQSRFNRLQDPAF